MYDNILKAMNGSGNGLSTQQKADNYNAFSKLMEDNVYLPDLIKKIDDLEKKVEKLDTPKDSTIDMELFAVMESAVKDDPSVIEAKSALQSNKTRIISELCMRDESYRKAYEDYRRKVNAAYISRREGSAEVRQEPQGQGTAKKSI